MYPIIRLETRTDPITGRQDQAWVIRVGTQVLYASDNIPSRDDVRKVIDGTRDKRKGAQRGEI